MDAAEALRAARRHAGDSQRALARRAGLAASAVSDIESGRHSPSLRQLDRLLAAAGLELGLEPRLPADPCGHLRAHLQLSLTARLHLAVGAGGPGRAMTIVQELLVLAGRAEVVIAGRAALGVWVPGYRAPDPLPCLVRARRGTGRGWTGPVGRTSSTLITPTSVGGGWRPSGLVAVPLSGSCGVLVPSPTELALDPEVGPQRLALRAAARLLHEEAACDEAQRRVPAHRDPDHAAEAEFVGVNRRLGGRGRAPVQQGRSWRLSDVASRDGWLREHGYRV